MRKIAIVTGTRAEYGLLYWIIKGIHEDPELELQLIVTGMHPSPEFGLTIKEIENDGFPITERVEMLLSSDTETAISISMGLGMIGFAKTYERLKPDVLVVLGDRFEIFSAVASAVPFRIPVAHIHGGESTEGAMDELFRHAITKMSHVHFPTTQIYANRIAQMGESQKNVFCCGAPGVDSIYKLKLLNKNSLSREIGLPPDKKIGIVTYHPVTIENNTAESQMSEIVKALYNFQDIYWVFTLSNADTGGRIINTMINDFVKNNSNRGKAFASLGQVRYISLLKYADVMVGNSSSGIIEAPSFELPVVNIGNRQKGRLRTKNVIDVPVFGIKRITTSIKKALSKEFKDSLKGLQNPYGKGDTSVKIVKIIKTISLANIFRKQFNELKLQRGQLRWK